MVERRWHMFLRCRDYPNRDDPRGYEGDRLLEKAGLPRSSRHTTEAEAKAAAKDALRKLKKVTDVEWDACYVQLFEAGVGRELGDPYPRTRIIRSGDVSG